MRDGILAMSRSAYEVFLHVKDESGVDVFWGNREEQMERSSSGKIMGFSHIINGGRGIWSATLSGKERSGERGMSKNISLRKWNGILSRCRGLSQIKEWSMDRRS